MAIETAPIGQNEFDEVRSYSKEHSQKERDETAAQIKQKRADYFERQKDVSGRMEVTEKERAENEQRIAEIAKQITQLELHLAKTKESILAKLLGFAKLDQRIDPRVKKASDDLEIGKAAEEEIHAKLGIINHDLFELRQAELDRRELDEARLVLGEFWQNQSETWQAFEKDEQIRNVSNMCREQNCILVHCIHPTYTPGSNSLLDQGVGWQEKLKIMLALEPIVATSTVFPKDDGNLNLWSKMGVIVNNGRIQSAFPGDAATIAVGVKERNDHIENYPFIGKIQNQIETAITNRGNSYNEFVVQDPEFAGFFVCLDASDNPYDDPKTKLADMSEINVLTKQFGIPLYALKKGEFYQTTINEHGGIFTGEKVSLEELLKGHYDVDGHREDLIENILANAPIKKERVAGEEAAAINSYFYGEEEYFKLKGKLIIQEKRLGDFQTVPYHRENQPNNNYGEGGLQIPEGTPVIPLGEVLKGKEKREYFLDTQEFFDPEIGQRRTESHVIFRHWDKEGHVAVSGEYYPQDYGFIQIGASGGATGYMFDGKSINTPSDYLEGMAQAFPEQIEKRKSAYEKYGDRFDNDYATLIRNLCFHLYGFAEQAQKDDNEEIALKAKEIAQEYLPFEKYQEIISKRLDEKGNFRLTRKDLSLE